MNSQAYYIQYNKLLYDIVFTVEPLIRDTSDKGHLSKEHPMLIQCTFAYTLNKGCLCIKDNFHGHRGSAVSVFFPGYN